MEIDWFTVIAQILNFLILVWLLKRFLYQPILDAVDDREKKITAQLVEAENKKEQALKERNLFQQKNAAFDIDRVEKMEQVRKEAEEEKHRLFDEVRKESLTLRSQYEASMKQETERMTELMKRKMQNEVFAIAHKTLVDLADASLEEQLVNAFIKKMEDLSEEEKARFITSFAVKKSIVVMSAFELPEHLKSRLEKVIADITGVPVTVQYDLAPELVSGIALHTDRFSLSWNIDSYLDSLKVNIIESQPLNP